MGGLDRLTSEGARLVRRRIARCRSRTIHRSTSRELSGCAQPPWRGRRCWASCTPSACDLELELEHGNREDPLRLYCEVDGDLLLDASICDEGLPDTPPAALEDDWTAFVQSPHGTERYVADVIIEPPLTVTLLAAKLRDLVDAVSAGERPVRRIW